MKKKKILAAVLSLTLVFGAAGNILPKGSVFDTGMTASAEDTPETSGKCGENATWEYKDRTLYIRGTGDMQDWKMGYDRPWKNSYFCYEHNDTCVKKIVVEEGITGISNYSFKGLEGAESAELPDSVTHIDQFAFNECENLKKVNIPATVQSIGVYAFSDCDLEEVTLPDGIKTIEMYTFASNIYMENANIPDSVTAIDSGAFQHCWLLKDFKMPPNLKTIDDYAFFDTPCIGDQVLPEGLTSIGKAAFYNCRSTHKIVLPDSLTEIGEKAIGYYSYETSDKEKGCGENIGGTIVADDMRILCHKNTAGEQYCKDNGFEYLGTTSDGYEEYTTGKWVAPESSSEADSSKTDDSSSKTDSTPSGDDSSSKIVIVPGKDESSEPDKDTTGGEDTTGKSKGDVNGDKNIDVEDAVMIINSVNGAKALTEEEEKLADVDGSGNIDIEDAVAVIAHVNGVKAIN